MYVSLKITARKPATKIWLGDMDGHLVQAEIGVLDTSILPSEYTVQFELHGPCYWIELYQSTAYTQDELETATPIPRPRVNLGRT